MYIYNIIFRIIFVVKNIFSLSVLFFYPLSVTTIFKMEAFETKQNFLGAKSHHQKYFLGSN
jgi:hypothetical protein